MKKLLFGFMSLLFVVTILPEATAENLCEQQHQRALAVCASYKHEVEADALRSLSPEVQKRAAEKEKAKTLALGRSCAKAQSLCSRTCSSAIAPAIEGGGDWGHYLDLSSDCREGEVARHRKEMAKRFELLSRMSDTQIAQNRP